MKTKTEEIGVCRMDIDQVKLEIKQWEHSFKKNHGKAPTKEDIKQNPEIALKYKLYKSSKTRESILLQTPTKRKRTALQTPQKTSPPQPVEVDSPVYTTEIGPTPQLNGRVLSIFDVITSPKITPVKKVAGTTEEYSTPKKKLDFSLIEDEEKENTTIEPFKTPIKKLNLHIQETPAYLKGGQTKQVITASPSPLASQRIRKGLSTIINELHDIQDELKYGDFDEDELLPLGFDEIEEDQEGPGDGDHIPRYKKKKTQKRQTRRVKMKARPTTEKDDLADKNLKDEIKKLDTVEETNEQEDNASEEWSDQEDGTYVRQRLDPNAKYKPVINRNFKKLKINKKKGFFGKRSKW